MNKTAYYVRNRSASCQLTVLNASTSEEARKIAHSLIGEKNKSRLSAFPASAMTGYGRGE
jgi:uncharacterized protein (UPF0212 family)